MGWIVRSYAKEEKDWSDGDEWPEIPGVLIADTPTKCRHALRIIKALDVVGVDTEYYGDFNQKKEHSKGKAIPIAIQFAGTRGPRIFVPLWSGRGDSVNLRGRMGLLQIFKEWLESDTYQTKVGHNIKADMHVLANEGITLRGLLGDTNVMDYLIDNAQMLHGLKECIRRNYRGEHAKLIAPYTYKESVDYKEMFAELKPLKKAGKDGEVLYGKKKWVPPLDLIVRRQSGVNKLVEYAVKDPFFTAVHYKFLKKRLQDRAWIKGRSYFDYYEQFELPYTTCLFEMEREGCPIDVPYLKEAKKRIEAEILKVERAFLQEAVSAGVAASYMEKFNFGSNQQLIALFDELGVKVRFVTNTGKMSVGKASIEDIISRGEAPKATRRKRLGARLAKLKQRHTSLTKLNGTYISKFIVMAPQYKGHLHTNLKQAATATFRLSSSGPNLQNIPTGKKDDEFKIRQAFIAKDDTEVIADIDLSQIETRITAHFTHDETLIALLKNNWDQHLIAMCILFPAVLQWMKAKKTGGKITFSEDRPPLSDDDVKGSPGNKLHNDGKEKFGKAQWGEWRRRAKILNFGIIYGMGPQGFVAQVGGGVTKEYGKIVIADYFKGFPGLAWGIKRIRQECYSRGYVRTILRRYCDLPEIRSESFKIRGSAERRAFNYVVQGSAADILKMAMLLIYKDERLRKWGVKMILQIHDELVFRIPKKHLEKARPILEDYVARPYAHYGFKSLIVDTPAALGSGNSWYEAKK